MFCVAIFKLYTRECYAAAVKKVWEPLQTDITAVSLDLQAACDFEESWMLLHP